MGQGRGSRHAGRFPGAESRPSSSYVVLSVGPHVLPYDPAKERGVWVPLLVDSILRPETLRLYSADVPRPLQDSGRESGVLFCFLI